MKTINYINPKYKDQSWAIQHLAAVNGPRHFEIPIVGAIDSWVEYALAAKDRYDSDIGNDYVLGPAWVQWGKALRVLLDGDCGRLDCGTLNNIIVDNLLEQGVQEKDL